ncbi:tetratricopeptide repeat protein [Lentibacillus sp. Marseille-P4043]|uniref:tetratricopeptide repeat protein n=1 Tax=Lentibacillus sp. Marseille-P4043 TaxID=2040293 RepID=UPI000D0BE0C6|nr:hypothetical protein [Lentibacillus sp. Marseille-P4043]
MTTNQFSIRLNKKNLDLTPCKMTMYRQAKIIEACDNQQNFYYLFFYKNNFLTGAKANNINDDSFIHRAFSKGIVFDGLHPITTILIKKQKAITFVSFKQLYNKVQQKYSPIETVHIFTFFDSFLPHETIQELLKQVYNHHRRDGKIVAAYQLLTMYQHYDDTYNFANDMLNNIAQFHSHQQHTDYVKDPINAETYYFDHLSQTDVSPILIQLYKDQNRWIDELIIRIHLLTNQFTSENFTYIQELLEKFNKEDQLYILKSLDSENNKHTNLQEVLFASLVDAKNANEIVRFVITHDYRPHPDQLSKIGTSMEKADNAIFPDLFHQSNSSLIQLFATDHKMLENACTRFVSTFLTHYSLEQIQNWFIPFHEASIHLPIEQKVTKLKTLENDPDQQLPLGKIYLEFNQVEKAIDCFKWEMELTPENPEPVKLLANVYKQIGNEEEAYIYQQLLIQLKKDNVG